MSDAPHNTTVWAREEDLARQRQHDDLAAAHRHGETDARVYAAQVERAERMRGRATPAERCETMTRPVAAGMCE